MEHLGGGVGLIDLGGFGPPEAIGPTVAAAMTFLSGCDSVIVDIRQNGGGDPAGVILLCSYFFDKQTHLNSIFDKCGVSNRLELALFALRHGLARL